MIDTIATSFVFDLCLGSIAKVIADPLTSNSSVTTAAFKFTFTTMAVGQIAYFILKRCTSLSPEGIYGIVIVIPPLIAHFVTSYLVPVSLTPTAFLTLSGVTLLAFLTVCAVACCIKFIQTLHNTPQVISNGIITYENRAHKNLDSLRDLLGIPRRFPDHPPIPHHRLTRELTFVSFYTAAMFLGGCLNAFGNVTPLVNGMLWGTVALIDSVSRVAFARLNLWNLNVKDFTDWYSLAYSFIVVNLGTQNLLFPELPYLAVNWAVISLAMTTGLIAGIVFEAYSIAYPLTLPPLPTIVQSWIFQQPLLPTEQPDPQPLSL